MVVVGAGIVGLCTAMLYKRAHPHHRVLVLERGERPQGASVRNAGFACFGSPSEVLADIDQEGVDVAVARVEERWRGLRELRAELGDPAMAFTPSGGYELFAHTDPLYARVADRFDRLNDSLSPVFGRAPYSWADERIPSLGLATGHLAFTDLEGPVDSGRLVAALLAKTLSEGVELRTHWNVDQLEEAPGHVTLVNGSERIEADRVVIATNGYLRQLLPQADVLPARGQVLLTSPIPGLRLKGTFHADEGYYYFRDMAGRVLLGGGRHLDKAGETTWEDSTTPAIQSALEDLLRSTIIPGHAFTIERRWSGVMGFRSQGKSPLLERQGERVVVAAGLNGMGVAIGIRVARQAVALVAD